MFELGEISFGDTVRILRTDATTASGRADLIGTCFGLTRPSATGVEVVGNVLDDAAVNVGFDLKGTEDAWFSPDLVLLVDHAAGTQATVGDQEFVKAADGSWSSVSQPATGKVRRRRWFGRS